MNSQEQHETNVDRLNDYQQKLQKL